MTKMFGRHWPLLIVAGVLTSCGQGTSDPSAVVSELLGSNAENKPGCANQKSQDLVAQIAKDKNWLIGQIRYEDGGGAKPPPLTCEDDPICGPKKKNLTDLRSILESVAKKCQSIAEEGDNYDDCPNNADNLESGDFSNWGADISYERAVWSGERQPTIHILSRPSARKTFMEQEGKSAYDEFWSAKTALQSAEGDLEVRNQKAEEEAWERSVQTLSYHLENIITTAKDEELGAYSCKSQLIAEVPGWGSASSNIEYKIETTSKGELYGTVWNLR